MELFLNKAVQTVAIQDRELELNAFESMNARLVDYPETEQYKLYVAKGLVRCTKNLQSAKQGRCIQA